MHFVLGPLILSWYWILNCMNHPPWNLYFTSLIKYSHPICMCSGWLVNACRDLQLTIISCICTQYKMKISFVKRQKIQYHKLYTCRYIVKWYMALWSSFALGMDHYKSYACRRWEIFHLCDAMEALLDSVMKSTTCNYWSLKYYPIK